MNEALLSPFDIALVRRLARIANEGDADRTELLAHAVAAVRDSHVCLSPALHARRLGLDDAAALRGLRALEGSKLVARVAAADAGTSSGAPFVLDEAHRLYLARYFDHQQALASRIVALAKSAPAAHAPVNSSLVDALFPASAASPDLQREAALHAARHTFTIVSGGPGTGKTSTVVKLLALLVDAEMRGGGDRARIAMLAPTGKAAARLAESGRGALARLPLSAEVRDAIPTQASTIHRALGVRRSGGFVHGVERPLDADVVIVDEASMIDLATMRALLDAIRPGARVVLLGDRDQLASVEAGSVLADLCDAATADGSPIAGCLRMLVHSHRFDETSGIGALARAIRAGDASAAGAILADDRYPDVTLEAEIPERGLLPASLQRAAREGYADLLAGAPARQLAALTRFRVLAAHRRGPLGVERLGERLARSIGREPERDAFGTPLLVLENDAEVGLFNGDVGVVGRTNDGAATAFFPSDAGPRAVGFGRLPRHEACWAMSIHKSQGSEFDAVSVVIPEGSVIASRELLYTAVTRARAVARIHASARAIEACIARPVVRASGLVDAILARRA